MIGMDFLSFLVLLVISVVVSAILHFGVKFYVIPGWGSYFGKVAVGWLGAWLGSPVLGHWWEGLNRGQLYYVPAILGSLASLVLMVDVIRSTAQGSAEEMEVRIRVRAYERYLTRRGAPGSDVDDWLQAEREIRRRVGWGRSRATAR
jgi:uncharacterized membrane protein YeaQ/YmgE (transglycosylase-associated protein family)